MATDEEAGILGSKNSQTRARAIIAGVIEATDGVTGIAQMSASLDTASRTFNVTAEVATIYGIVTLSL